jgi:integrase
MPSIVELDACGRRRSPATLSSFHQGRPPRNKGQRYPADPPTVEEIIAVMHAAGDDRDAIRLRGLIIVPWRAGLRISEALALAESDLDLDRGAILVRCGLCRIRHRPCYAGAGVMPSSCVWWWCLFGLSVV